MARTIASLLTDVRRQIKDNRDPATAPYRHSTAKLLSYFNNGLSDMRRMRPDLFLPGLVDTEFAYTNTPADLAKPLPVEWSYMTPLIDFIVGTIEMEEDEYVQDGRAAALFTRFSTKLIGRGA